MSVLRIIRYFFSEALVSLRRSWKVSLLAVLAIAVSAFVGGGFLLVSSNLGRVVAEWRREARILVYFRDGVSADQRLAVQAAVTSANWVIEVEEVSATEAEARFLEIFPSLGALLDTREGQGLPASLEVSFDPDGLDQAAFEEWLQDLRRAPGVALVDDDRDWLRQLQAAVTLLRGLGLAVGGVLLGAAILTIASVIRLTVYLHREEIAVMRLVGATELFIRGPFYCEGLIQGLLGGLLAVLALYLGFLVVDPQSSTLLLGTVLVDRFLSSGSLLALLGLSSVAGGVGAVLSLRREILDS